MANKPTIQQIRAYLLENGPLTVGEMVKHFKPRSSGAFGRILSLHGEGGGLIRFRVMEQGRMRTFWKADPYYKAPFTSTQTSAETDFRPPKPEEESAQRLAENLHRFRQERQSNGGHYA